jgi:hypothetical protein
MQSPGNWMRIVSLVSFCVVTALGCATGSRGQGRLAFRKSGATRELTEECLRMAQEEALLAEEAVPTLCAGIRVWVPTLSGVERRMRSMGFDVCSPEGAAPWMVYDPVLYAEMKLHGHE